MIDKLGIMTKKRVLELLEKDADRTEEEEKEFDDALTEFRDALVFLTREGFDVHSNGPYVESRITIKTIIQ